MTDAIGVVVMASGSGSRFGSGNKLLADCRGKPLLHWVLEALPSGLFAKRLVVTRSDEIAGLARAAGFETLVHGLPDISDTIRLGTQAMSGMDGCLYAVGDQPFLTAETVGRVVAMFRACPDRIVRAGKDGRMGNPALFPSACFKALCTLAEGQGGNAVMSSHPELVTVAEAVSELELYDVDTQADYDRLKG